MLQGRHGQAADHFDQALRIARGTGNRNGEVTVLTGLGHIYRRQGRYGRAADHYQQLLDLAQEAGDRNFEFEAWQGLAGSATPPAATANSGCAVAGLGGILAEP